MEPMTICRFCSRLRASQSCEAYPEPWSIPEAIWSGRDHHFEPRPGDHGLQYELDPDQQDIAAAMMEAGYFDARVLTHRGEQR